MPESDETLPGLELNVPAPAAGPLERAAAKSLEAIRPKLRPRDALTATLVLELARVIDKGVAGGKASAAAMAAAQLREAWAALEEVAGVEGAGVDPFEALLERLGQADEHEPAPYLEAPA
jgi:hypothetical protein